jgi:hypothetical protein
MPAKAGIQYARFVRITMAVVTGSPAFAGDDTEFMEKIR